MAIVVALLASVLALVPPVSARPPKHLPTLSVDDVSVGEVQRGAAVFTVTLEPGEKKVNRVVTVDYTTADGTATARRDYVPASGTLVFDRGETHKQVAITIKDDSEVEPDENFFIHLAGAENATIARSRGEATIIDDDTPPEYTLTVTCEAYDFWTQSVVPCAEGTLVGQIVSSPSGIVCGADCEETYTEDTVVTLTYEKGNPIGSSPQWEDGDCDRQPDVDTCIVIMSGDRHVEVFLPL